jgi:hypothetical protein
MGDNFARRLALAAISLALVSGCGSQGSSPAVPAMLQQTQHSSAATSRPLLYVENFTLRHEHAYLHLLGFDVNANGNVPPVFSIGGKQVYKGQRGGVDTNISTDKSGRIYSTGPDLDAIAVWPAGSDGDVPWTAYFTVGCDSFSVNGIRFALDRAGHVWVACLLGQDPFTSAIYEYPAIPADAKGPIASKWMREITGSNTGLSEISAIALNGKGQVSVEVAGAILTFADTARGNVAPLSSLSAQLGNWGASTMKYDSQGQLDTCRIENFGRIQTLLTFAPGAQGNDAPISSLSVPGCSAFALDSQGNIYIGYNNSILVYAAGATGTAQPIRTITGNLTTLTGAGSVSF